MVTKITLCIQSNYEAYDVYPCSLILAEKWLQSQMLGTGGPSIWNSLVSNIFFILSLQVFSIMKVMQPNLKG